MTGIKRNIHDLSEKLLVFFPVLSIIGARQCGKTTLSKQLRPDWLYFDLENPRDFDRISNDPLLFFEQHEHSIIIDEAQLLPEIFPVLRGVIDKKRELKGRFILTGSSSPDLLNNISESLAGRIANIELSTMKANERYQQPLSNFYNAFETKIVDLDISTLEANLSLPQIRKHWLYGGYPEIITNDSIDYWINWMNAYRDSYLNRDMAALFPKINKTTFRRFLQMLAKLSGTIINKSDFARNLEVSQPSIHEYISIAEGTFIWRNLHSYEKNISKSLIKMPRGFIRDTGLYHFLIKLYDEESLYSDPLVGHSFEGFVIEEIIKGLQAKGITNFDTFFYRTRGGAEVDLILEGSFGVLPIEIKYGSHTPIRNLKSLNNFIKNNNLSLGLVINQANNIARLTPEIIQLPINYL